MSTLALLTIFIGALNGVQAGEFYLLAHAQHKSVYQIIIFSEEKANVR